MLTEPITDAVGLYTIAARDFRSRVARVPATDWHTRTPCSEWDVRDLVRHVVEEDLWAVGLLAGLSLEDAGRLIPADALVPDPATACTAAVEAALDIARHPDTLRRTVQLSFGPTPAAEYLMQLTADHVVHAWDLAVARHDTEPLPTELVAAVLHWFAEHEDAYRAAGAVGPRPPLPDDADALTRLLAAFGRTP